MTTEDERRLVSKFSLIEQEGLRRSEATRKPNNDTTWWEKLEDAVNEEMRPKFHNISEFNWKDYAAQLALVANMGRKEAKNCQFTGENRRTCNVGSEMKSALTRMNQISHYARGGYCTNIWEQIKSNYSGSRYTYDELVNDTTSCLHRAIEHYADVFTNWEKSGKCKWWIGKGKPPKSREDED